MKKFLAVFETKSPLGVVRAVATDMGICEIRTNQKSQPIMISQNKHLRAFCNWLKLYLSGGKKVFSGVLDLHWANKFDVAVYKKLRDVKYGEVATYSKIAKAIGKSGAARAVGNSLAKNKLPIVIPCHRVISSDGSLGGYSGGLKMKKFLLRLESTEDTEITRGHRGKRRLGTL